MILCPNDEELSTPGGCVIDDEPYPKGDGFMLLSEFDIMLLLVVDGGASGAPNGELVVALPKPWTF